MDNNDLALKKALLLAKAKIKLHSDIELDPDIKLEPDIKKNEQYRSKGNLGRNDWIFIRISETSRVRLNVDKNASLLLVKNSENGFDIQDLDTNEIILNNVTIERILSHAPEQLFFLLYKKCRNNCQFCPRTYIPTERDHYPWEDMQKRILETKDLNLRSISVTTSSPPDRTKEKLVNEMIDIAKGIREIMGNDFPIGMSLQTPSEEQLWRLKEAGVSEMRLNLETYNPELAKKIMPNKDIDEILKSIEYAVKIFGREKVSSNIIIGLDKDDTKEDNHILQGVEVLSKMGALSTLYPYDYIELPVEKFKRPIEPPDEIFKRPSAERIFDLAKKHKEILEKYGLDPLAAKTMCCSCAASHLYPGRDI